jgi:cytochrome c553
MDLWPNLAGQKKGYLIKQMKAFRDGTRVEPSMSPMAKPLTDADIENLAEYYSTLK